MKSSRLNKMIAGITIIFVGFGLFLDNLGLVSFSVVDLFPLIPLYFGFRLLSKKRRIFGGLLIAIGSLLLIETWLGLNIDDVIGFIIPIAIIYFGFYMIRRKRSDRDWAEWSKLSVEDVKHGQAKAYDTQVDEADAPYMRIETSFPLIQSRRSLIGDFHLTSGRFELQNMYIWHGIGNVVIDLSRAVIHDEETFLEISGWVGDVTVYVPVDLPIFVAAEVMLTLGDMEVLGHRQGGLNRRAVISSKNYEDSVRKVKLIISLHVGDIDVKYI